MKHLLLSVALIGITGIASPVRAQTVDNQIGDLLNQQDSGSIATLAASVSYSQFNSCSDMNTVTKKFIEDNIDSLGVRRGPIVYAQGGLATPVAVNVKDAATATAVAPSATASNGSVDFSTTNIQKIGVDEGDIIKNNATNTYYYDSQEQKIYVVSATGTIQTEINVPSSLQSPILYLNGKNLIILASRYVDNTTDSFLDKSSRTTLVVYDMSNLAKPRITKFTDIDGSLSDSRMIGNTLYVISSVGVNRRWYQQSPKSLDFSNTAYLPKSYDISLTTPKPTVSINTTPCNQVSYILPSSDTLKNLGTYPQFTVISQVNTQDTSVKTKSTVLFGNSDQIHLSQKGLYITQSIYNSRPYACPLNAMCAMRIFGGDSQTLIHKFSVPSLTYTASALVNGSLLNQYSMDEDDSGDFRILTRTWATTNATNLYTFTPTLRLAGSLTNIETGENFQASRFIGNTLYLVTMQQIDPLLVIDLSTLAAPKIVGELKIPGYSTYLHPFGTQTNGVQYLIGLGYDTQTGSRGGTENAGIKLDLYKINFHYVTSGMVAITRVDSQTFGNAGSYSEALDNPRLFVLSSDNHLTLPLYLTDKTVTTQQCNVNYDQNGVETTKQCRPITSNALNFVGLKSWQVTTNGFAQSDSQNFQKTFETTIGTGLQTWSLYDQGMRVGYRGSNLFFFSNDFASFGSTLVPFDSKLK